MKNDDTHFDFSNEGTRYLATDRGTLVHNLLSYFNFKLFAIFGGLLIQKE